MRKFLILLTFLVATQPGWQPLRGQTTLDQRGTQHAPLFVDGLGRAKSTQDASDEKLDKEHAALINGLAVAFTGIAAVCSALLVWVGWRGVHAANKTLKEIERQANLMTRQIEVMENQITAVRDQEDLMRDTAIRQLRAYICVDSAVLRFIGNGGASFEVQVDIKNSGQTPAYGLKSWIGVWIDKTPLTQPLSEPPEWYEMSDAVIRMHPMNPCGG